MQIKNEDGHEIYRFEHSTSMLLGVFYAERFYSVVSQDYGNWIISCNQSAISEKIGHVPYHLSPEEVETLCFNYWEDFRKDFASKLAALSR